MVRVRWFGELKVRGMITTEGPSRIGGAPSAIPQALKRRQQVLPQGLGIALGVDEALEEEPIEDDVQLGGRRLGDIVGQREALTADLQPSRSAAAGRRRPCERWSAPRPRRSRPMVGGRARGRCAS